MLEARFPTVPFLWPELLNGGEGIALVSAADLGPQPAAQNDHCQKQAEY